MKKPRTYVSDHALLRYLERVLGVDVETHRREVGHMVDRAVQLGASGIVIEGFSYRIAGETVTTVLPTGGPDIRLGRKPGCRA